jgi:hypothetical protein
VGLALRMWICRTSPVLLYAALHFVLEIHERFHSTRIFWGWVGFRYWQNQALSMMYESVSCCQVIALIYHSLEVQRGYVDESMAESEEDV